MRYTYSYRLTAGDLWQLAMYNTYRSLAGMCNLIFTAAMAALLFGRPEQLTQMWQPVLLLGLCWFPLVHPVLVYRKMMRQARQITDDILLSLGESGLEVKSGVMQSWIPWPKVMRILNRPTCLILLLDGRHGYILPNRIVGRKKQELQRYVNGKLSI